MRFFTPDLIQQGCSHDDAVIDRAERLWDEASALYEGYLDSVRTHMPAGVRMLLDNYYLHDAAVQGIGWRDGKALVVLQLDTPPRSLLTLCYDLIEEPVVDRTACAVPSAASVGAVTWQYDEIEQVPGGGWKQSVLMSNGWEMQILFRDLHIEEVRPLLPATLNGATTPSPQSTSEL